MISGSGGHGPQGRPAVFQENKVPGGIYGRCEVTSLSRTLKKIELSGKARFF